ncbi:MAG: hypothetical protein LBD21_02815 [Tannerellaceae bacterium]|jgi:hypothetical protein|nr:hypothetical protein [Tannerellaceae bacterium]
MEKTSRIDSILSDIKELERLMGEMRNMDVYPVACFSRSFDLAYHLLKDLHILEGEQIESLHRQMEEYRRMIDSAPPPAVPAPPPVPPAAEAEPHQSRPATLNDAINKGRLADLRKSLVLNDRFYFRKELFGGDEARMNRAIDDLNAMRTLDESLAYLREKLQWDENNAVVAEFTCFIEKRFG